MKSSVFKHSFRLCLLVIFASAVLFASCKAEEDDEMNSLSFNAGWNLGNTLDANSTGDKSNKGLSTETSWGMPATRQAMIQAVAQKGFKTIRIPVSWHNHITDASNYTIDSAWMARVKEIVDWSLAYGLKVIINIHHDNLSEEQMSSTYGFCVPENNTTLKNQSKSYISAIWRQISAAFKDYDERLIFELLNEPRAVGKKYEWNTPSGEEAKVRAANSIIREYENAALDVIRAGGGKNASRYVMVAPYAASPSMTDGWSLPRDKTSGRLIVSLHAYAPFEFCMKDMYVTSFGSSQKASLDWLFKTIKSSYTSKGIPVIIGEASASDKNNTSERIKWAEYYFGKAKALGIPVLLWDNMSTVSNGGSDPAERHGYFDRKDLSWFFPDLINAMMK